MCAVILSKNTICLTNAKRCAMFGFKQEGLSLCLIPSAGKPRFPAQTVDKKLFSPLEGGRIALSANERIAEFLDFAIQAKFAYVNKLRRKTRGFWLFERVNIGACVSDFCFYGQKSTQNGGLISVCLSKRKPLAQFFSEDRFQVDSGRFSPICFQGAMCLNL